ncbi:MAG: hypothetical protein P0Y55_01955 [Candidatus Cohnella colombiensis]|uniref:Uncharacterized protein n=1 Tax=Candidatus Cohnella colombiensis TaxID=3121368 RepID=A0AA95EZG6_9BACL|nr:MAG: hypothetical protein P0Y55_01955 [Cohnella sp.]
MSKLNEDYSELKKLFTQSLSSYTDRCVSAMMEGATNIGDNLKESAEELARPSSIITEKFLDAFKSGAVVAGDQLKAASLDFIDALKSYRSKL